jgi:hypothetical protein
VQHLTVNQFVVIALTISQPVFLCTLKHAPESTQQGLKISQDEWNSFKELKDKSKMILQAVKAFKGQKESVDDED